MTAKEGAVCIGNPFSFGNGALCKSILVAQAGSTGIGAGFFIPTPSAPIPGSGITPSTFNTVELNAPFYSWPKLSTVKSWRRNAPEGFRYSVKVNRLITHEKRMVHTRMLVEEFYAFETILETETRLLPLSISAELSLYAFASGQHFAAARSEIPERGRVPPPELVA